MLQSFNPATINAPLVQEIASGNILDMRSIKLSYSNIDTDTAILLFTAFAKMKSLTHIDLSSNSIGFKASCAIKAFLQTYSAISDLNLNFNNLQDLGAKLVLEGATSSKSLKKTWTL